MNALVLALLLATQPAPPDAGRRLSAQEELERELMQLVKTPPPEVEVFFEPLEARHLKLDETDLTLDDMPLALPDVKSLSQGTTHRVLKAQLSEGEHTLVSRIAYVDTSSGFTGTAGYKWKMAASVTFRVQRGLRVRVRVQPALNPDAADLKGRLKLGHHVVAEMIGPLEDTKALEALARGPSGARPATAAKPLPVASPAAPGRQIIITQHAKLAVSVSARKRPLKASVRVRGERSAASRSAEFSSRSRTCSSSTSRRTTSTPRAWRGSRWR